ncbi:MAG TPA: nitroreductase family deazaflavin-dependent oxidoreductase [Mycobacteriales bacterium]|jgi:deazaflavin-dependent oxidoreductase (nitroreductase family)|nr:nitroreductase family deazaflavin-dependent oxidoreductase [Mycobacteriales bacterium]
MSDEKHYQQPGRIQQRFLNPAVAWLTRHGMSLQGSRVLQVAGRSSGEPRRTPVNLLTVGQQRYLVSARGNGQWVRNLRIAGTGELLLGRRVEEFAAEEVADADKPAVLRAYLKKWKWEVGAFFDGVGADASDEELLRIAGRHPVFAIRER